MTEKTHTHYDNLKITRNAPLEVIKAAYRAMAQKYHPDRHPGKDAERVMKLVNEAWDVLSDPKRRAEHDRWIADQEAAQRARDAAHKRPVDPSSSNGARPTASQNPPEHSRREHHSAQEVKRPKHTEFNSKSKPEKSANGVEIMLALGAIFFTIYMATQGGNGSVAEPDSTVSVPRAAPSKIATLPKPAVASPPTLASGSRQDAPADRVLGDSRERRALLEYGQSLPLSSGPIRGSMQSSSTGLSSVTIDNSQNSTDVVVKLCDGSWAHCLPSRHIYIGKGDRFTLHNVTPGSYDVRYVSLESGALSKSPKFELEEIETSQGTQFSNVTMTLYTVSGGNTRMTKIGTEQF